MSSAAPSVALPDAAALLASLPGPLLALDPANRIAYANDSAESFFGRSRARLEGMAVDQLLPFVSRRLQAALCEPDENLSAQEAIIAFSRTDRRTVDVVIAPLVGQEGWRIVALTPRPGEREHLGTAVEPGEQAALGAPAVLSHEIKNPLAGIKGAAQLLGRGIAEAQRPLTDLIIAEVDRIARIIDQMQHLGTRTKINAAPVNIHIVLNRALQSLRSANAQVPDVRVNFDPSLPEVLIDSDAVLQVLINLLQNAVDALHDTPDPRIVVTTRFVMGGALKRPGSEDGGVRAVKLPVEVNVADNGPGVAAHIRADLFSPFVTTKREGQGLGLAIVQKLMRDMGARVTHERDAGDRWTQFRLFLPIGEEGTP